MDKADVFNASIFVPSSVKIAARLNAVDKQHPSAAR